MIHRMVWGTFAIAAEDTKGVLTFKVAAVMLMNVSIQRLTPVLDTVSTQKAMSHVFALHERLVTAKKMESVASVQQLRLLSVCNSHFLIKYS
ncbi:hypothetical protein FCM35_KLT03574 [Carex littledalei]|uniref:Uncharacterized protein n=1 Tax=Carex littledalei TaxID=544730 RepID=A0A833RB69_9POAL|nr:hypothetical protein FCM35_KLT03574 [Carex littledalei]